MYQGMPESGGYTRLGGLKVYDSCSQQRTGLIGGQWEILCPAVDVMGLMMMMLHCASLLPVNACITVPETKRKPL